MTLVWHDVQRLTVEYHIALHFLRDPPAYRRSHLGAPQISPIR